MYLRAASSDIDLYHIPYTIDMISLYSYPLWTASLFIAITRASILHTSPSSNRLEYGAQLDLSDYQSLYVAADDSEPSWLKPSDHISLYMEWLVRNLTINPHSPLKSRALPDELPIGWSDIPGAIYDSSCDNGRKSIVDEAFKSGILLSTTARDAATAVYNGINGLSSATQRKQWIAANNFAYTQMFGADDNPSHAQIVAGVFQKILDRIQTPNAQGRNNQPLHIFCRESFFTKPTALRKTTVDECVGSPPTLAFTVRLDQAAADDIVKRYPKPDPAEFVINFCKPFFSLKQNENLEINARTALVSNDKAALAQLCSLNVMQNTAQIMVHEWTHLPWIQNTNSDGKKEWYGFAVTSQSALDKNKKVNWEFISMNAESYSWFAVYNHWNSLDVAQGISYTDPRVTYSNPTAGCTDIWPSVTSGTDQNRKYVRTRY
ncbi:hypothetical protein MMC11_001446 [Xylographa trunciseda]|nr:hypothetical protein [Xylographa trunciseda]